MVVFVVAHHGVVLVVLFNPPPAAAGFCYVLFPNVVDFFFSMPGDTTEIQLKGRKIYADFTAVAMYQQYRRRNRIK
jgi:hypothetical protein